MKVCSSIIIIRNKNKIRKPTSAEADYLHSNTRGKGTLHQIKLEFVKI